MFIVTKYEFDSSVCPGCGLCDPVEAQRDAESYEDWVREQDEVSDFVSKVVGAA